MAGRFIPEDCPLPEGRGEEAFLNGTLFRNLGDLSRSEVKSVDSSAICLMKYMAQNFFADDQVVCHLCMRKFRAGNPKK